MKAIVRDRYGAPDVLRLDDMETPVPGEGEVVVRVRAASLNTADLDYLRGRPPLARVSTGLRRPKNPVLGFDVAGEVETVGPGARRLRPGDAVWADLTVVGGGAFAERVRASEDVFHGKPAELGFEEAATVPHSGLLALQGLQPGGGVRCGDRVLINGAGGCVGPFAIQIAKAAGAEVTAVDHTSKLELLRSLGADRVVDYTQEDVTRSGQLYDRVLDVAATRSVLRFRRCLAPGGVYALIAPSVARFFEAVMIGAALSVGRDRRLGAFSWRPNDGDDLAHLGSLIAAGKVRPLIDRRCALSDVPDGLRLVEEGRAHGKLVITL